MAADGSDQIVLRTVSDIDDIETSVWDDFAFFDGNSFNPFVSHTFLKALEESGSVTPESGWIPYHLILEDAGNIIGLAPCYIKTHSQGEYIFDHHWADAYERAGGRYYPKLLSASPFTPVPGPRIFCKDDAHYMSFASGIMQLAEKLKISSVHINFTTEQEKTLLENVGFLTRVGEQFHWQNRGYRSFEDFLAALSSRKRKTIRQERRKVSENGITIKSLSGYDINEEHWDIFWTFYQDTGARKWGTPYLTRQAFNLIGERMKKNLLLILAFKDENSHAIAGALHFIGSDTLYGRYWGCTEHEKFLHFECCYYQAIDYAIQHQLARIEAGAQGQHKLARGYEPVPTYSAHWIRDPSFRQAISQYLDHERQNTEEDIRILQEYTPYKKQKEPNDEPQGNL